MSRGKGTIEPSLEADSRLTVALIPTLVQRARFAQRNESSALPVVRLCADRSMLDLDLRRRLKTRRGSAPATAALP